MCRSGARLRRTAIAKATRTRCRHAYGKLTKPTAPFHLAQLPCATVLLCLAAAGHVGQVGGSSIRIVRLHKGRLTVSLLSWHGLSGF